MAASIPLTDSSVDQTIQYISDTGLQPPDTKLELFTFDQPVYLFDGGAFSTLSRWKPDTIQSWASAHP